MQSKIMLRNLLILRINLLNIEIDYCYFSNYFHIYPYLTRWTTIIKKKYKITSYKIQNSVRPPTMMFNENGIGS